MPISLPPNNAPSGEELDEALQMLAPYAASFRGGLSNHGPMTAEALVALGRQDAVVGWVENYRRRLEPRPTARGRIEPGRWQEALSDRSRSGDWHEWFANELAEAPWRQVVGVWVPRLAPGMAAAGFHSAIRAGHAVCSLAVKENAMRIDELARALAYWAAEFYRMPGDFSGSGELAPSRALKEVALLPNDQRTSRGLITTELSDLDGFESFVDVIDLVDPAAGAPNFMSDLLATFAGTFMGTSSNTFEFLHAVTGAAAIAELLPFVETSQRPAVQACTWQVTAGIFARYGRKNLVAEVDADLNNDDLDRLSALAVASGDEHTIKLTAACAREWRRNPDPRLLGAAARRTQRG